MSKRNREKRINPLPLIVHSLRTDFQCTDEQIELITYALRNMVPESVQAHADKALAGNYKMPEIKFALDMEDGAEPEEFAFTKHPVICLHHFLVETYGRDFGHIYWSAITSSSPREFFQYLPLLKRLINHRKEVGA